MSGQYKVLRDADLTERQSQGKEFSLEKIKSFIFFQLEAERRSNGSGVGVNLEPGGTRASVVESQSLNVAKSLSKDRLDMYNTCEQTGHWSRNCPLKSQGLWKCYVCKGVHSRDPSAMSNAMSTRE